MADKHDRPNSGEQDHPVTDRKFNHDRVGEFISTSESGIFDEPLPLADRLQSKLTRVPTVNNSAIKVLVDGRSVTLRGSVDSEVERMRAEEVVRSFDEVDEVKNELEISAGFRANQSPGVDKEGRLRYNPHL